MWCVIIIMLIQSVSIVQFYITPRHETQLSSFDIHQHGEGIERQELLIVVEDTE